MYIHVFLRWIDFTSVLTRLRHVAGLLCGVESKRLFWLASWLSSLAIRVSGKKLTTVYYNQLNSEVRQPSFSARSTNKRRARKTAKTHNVCSFFSLSYHMLSPVCLTLYDRRETTVAKLFDEICADQSHSLHKLLPGKCQPSYSLRENRTFIRPKCKTERCKNSFLYSYVYRRWELYELDGCFWICDFATYLLCNVLKCLGFFTVTGRCGSVVGREREIS